MSSKSISNIMSEIDLLLDDANKELVDLVNKSTNIDLTLPDFDDASAKRVLYNKYALIVNFNSECAQSIMKINRLLLSIKDIQNQLSSSNAYNYNVIQQFNLNIKNATQRVNDNLSNVENFKKSMDAILKFYNNLSFILTSPYLRDNI